MFAQSILNNYTAQIDNISTEIQALEAQLNALREQQKQLEAERQAMSTLASAGESAIAQAQQFLTLANRAGRTELIEAFWQEMDIIRNDSHAVADLPEETHETGAIDINDASFDTGVAFEDESTTIEVESQEIPDNDDAVEVKGISHNGNGYHTVEDVKSLLEDTSYAELRKLAKGRNLEATGKKRELIDRLLADNLTWEEVAN